MSENVVDTLRIEVVGDSSSAVGGLEKLISTLERIKSVTGGSNKGLNGVQKHLDTISQAADKINSGSISKIHELSENLKTLGSVKVSNKIADRITSIGVAVDGLKDVDMSKLTEMSSALSAMGNTGGNISSPVPNITSGTDTSAALDGQVFIPPSTVSDTTSKLEELGKTATKAGNSASNAGKTATKSTNTWKKATDGLFGGLKQLGTMLKKRIAYRVLNAVISAVTTSFRDGVNAVYQYSKAMDGRLANSLDSLASSFNYLKGSLGAMAAPLINLVAPAIELLIDKFVDLLNIANQVFARLSGATTWTRATKVATEYAAAADGATAANKRLKKSLLGIDEINALQDNSSNGGGGASGGDASAYAFEEVPLDTAYVDGIIDKLKDILWYVGAIGLGLLAWKIASPFMSRLDAVSLALAAIGATLVIKSIKGVLDDGLDLKDIIEGTIGGALLGAGLGFKFGGWQGAIGGVFIGIGVTLVIEGITSMFKEGVTPKNVGTTIIGALSTVIGIVSIVKLFNKKVPTGVPELDTAAKTMEEAGGGVSTLSTNTSTLTSKLSTLAKNLGLGLVIIAEVAAAAALIVGVIILLGIELDQVGKAWQPVLDNGETVAIAMGLGIAFLGVVGVATAALGSVGVSLVASMGLGIAVLAEIEVAALLFIAGIWAVGKGLDQIGIAWQPVLDNGENITTAIELGTALLIRVGAVCALLGVATVASAGLLPLAIGLGTAMLVELSAAFIVLCDSLIDVALKLIDLSYPLDDLNGMLPGLKEDMDSFTSFMKDFASSVVSFTASSVIAGIAATIDKVIGFFTTDPIKRMYDEVTDQTEEFEDLIPALEKINPLIAKATKLVGVYKSNMGSFESATGGSGGFLNSIVNGAKGVINGLISLFEGMANGVIKCINFLIKGLNKISFDVPDWVPVIGGKKFGFNIATVSEVNIPRLAEGGLVNAGQMFIAREAGAELVGNIGRQTAVMNNEQIVESVSQGVADANAEQNALLREEISILRKLLDKDTNVTAYVGTGSLIGGLERKNRRDGKTIVPVGV